MRHRETHRLHARDHRGRRCRAAGGDLHRLGECPARCLGRVDQHAQHHRRAAHMRHAILGDRGEDRRRLHAAETDMRAAGQRHRPGVGPAVAMEHRQRPEIDTARRQPERERIAAGIQIGAAVMQHDALRVAGRARRVVQRDRLPLIVRQPHRKVRVGGGDEWFVLAVDIDHQWPMPALRQRARHDRPEFAIDQHDLGFRMLQDERNRCRIQPDVDRAQHRAEHRHGIMRLQHLRNVGGHDRHGFTLADAGTRKCRCQPTRTLQELRIGVASLAMDHRDARSVHARRAYQERHRRQRHIIRRSAIEILFVDGHDAVLAQVIPFT